MDRGLFNEVKVELLKVAFIYTFLDSIMVYFIIYFGVSFFNIKFLYTLLMPGVVTVIFFVATIVIRVNRARLKDMEDANPQLREMLRTAHDNQKESSTMSEALFVELKGKMRTASSGNLMDSKKIMLRVVSAVIIVFLIVFTSSIELNMKKIDIPFDKLRFLSNSDSHKMGNITELVYNETEVVYGDASIAKLGNDVVNLNINPTMNDIDFDKVSDAEQTKLTAGGVPQEIGINPDAFNNQKMLDDAEAAANYSQRISKI